MKRRTVLAAAAQGFIMQAAQKRSPRAFQAVAFDGLAVFDLRPIGSRVEAVFPSRGAELTAVWRTRQFEYTWLRTLTGTYTDFWHITEDALLYAARSLKLELTEERRQEIMGGFSELKAWPDAPVALKQLREAGVRLVLLSNFTKAMLERAVSNSGLQGIFEPHLSTDRVRAYKPDRRAYRMATDALRVRREEIVFAAFAGWDAAGAKAFGLPTFWVNRLGSPLEELGSTPDGSGEDLTALARFVMASNRRQ